MDHRSPIAPSGPSQAWPKYITLNVQTGGQQQIAADAFLGLRSTGGVLALAMAAPQWQAQQNALILSKLLPNQKQAIVITDANGTVQQTLAIADAGSAAFLHADNLVIASAQSITQTRGARATLAVPELTGDALISFKENGHGRFAFLPQPDTLHSGGLDAAADQWSITTAALNKQSNLPADVEPTRRTFKDIEWSADGAHMAFWVGSATDQELWIADERGTTFKSLLVLAQARGGPIAWSPDGTMLAYTMTPTGAGANAYTSLSIVYIADGHSEVIATGVQLNPIWDPSSTQVAIEKGGIAIYRRQ